MEFTVVLPVRNEEGLVSDLVKRINKALTRETGRYEILFVDDCSSDGTVAILRTFRDDGYPVRVVVLERHLGQHGAVLAGLSAARGDYCISLDADLQDPPEIIPDFLSELRAGFDLVDGFRLSRTEGPGRKISSFMVNIIAALGGVRSPGDLGCMFRGMSRDVVDWLLEPGRNVRYIPAALTRTTFKRTKIVYHQEPRGGNDSKYGLFNLVGLLFRMLSEFPPRVKIRLSLMSAAGVVSAFLLYRTGLATVGTDARSLLLGSFCLLVGGLSCGIGVSVALSVLLRKKPALPDKDYIRIIYE